MHGAIWAHLPMTSRFPAHRIRTRSSTKAHTHVPSLHASISLPTDRFVFLAHPLLFYHRSFRSCSDQRSLPFSLHSPQGPEFRTLSFDPLPALSQTSHQMFDEMPHSLFLLQSKRCWGPPSQLTSIFHSVESAATIVTSPLLLWDH